MLTSHQLIVCISCSSIHFSTVKKNIKIIIKTFHTPVYKPLDIDIFFHEPDATGYEIH